MVLLTNKTSFVVSKKNLNYSNFFVLCRVHFSVCHSAQNSLPTNLEKKDILFIFFFFD